MYVLSITAWRMWCCWKCCTNVSAIKVTQHTTSCMFHWRCLSVLSSLPLLSSSFVVVVVVCLGLIGFQHSQSERAGENGSGASYLISAR
jgi:hypothetical protein